MQNKKMKSSILVGLVLVLAGLLISGCGSSQQAQQKETKEAPKASTGTQEKAPAGQNEKKKYTIGFATHSMALEFPAAVAESVKKAAEAAGVELVAMDNKADPNVALSNAAAMVARKVDLFIDYQNFAQIYPAIMEKMNAAKIPLIAVFVAAPGAKTLYGADDHTVGKQGGTFLGQYAKNNWKEKPIVVLLGSPAAGETMATRMKGYKEGILSVLPDIKDSDFFELDGQINVEKSMNAVQTFLTAHPKQKVLIAGGNDPMGEGAAAAVEAAGRNGDAAIAGMGGQKATLNKIKQPGSPYKATVDFNVAGYGPDLIKMALDTLAGKEIPQRSYPQTRVVSAENIIQYYPDLK